MNKKRMLGAIITIAFVGIGIYFLFKNIELKKVEDEIHKLETRDGEIDELLSQEEIYTDVARLVELNNEKESLQKKLEELYETWEELAE